MKRILILFLIVFSLISIKSQNKIDSIDILYQNVSKLYDSLNLKDDDVMFLEEAYTNLKPTYSKLLSLDNLSNKNIQRALVKNYEDVYSDAFIDRIEKNKKFKLIYNFDNKDAINEYIDKAETFLKINISYSMANLIYKDSKSKQKQIDDYINENLKRLGLSRKEYDEMSDSDRNLLIEQFK